MPGRQTAEHLAVLHGEVLRDTVRAAHRVGADAGARRLVDAGDVLLPLVAGAHGLAQAVVDHRPAAGLRQPRHHAIAEFRIDAAAHLDRAGAEFAQHIGEREDLLLVGPQRRNRHALRIEVSLLPRTREADRASLHAVAHHRLHRLDLIVGSGALLAVLAHRIVAHGRMADQRAGIDAEPVVEPVHVLREALPIDVDGAQHLHRDGFDIGQELSHALFVAAAHRGQRERAVAKDHSRCAVLRREGAQRIPRYLRIVVAVVVDETGRHCQAVGIDGARRRTGDLANFDDLAVLHSKVAAECRHP